MARKTTTRVPSPMNTAIDKEDRWRARDALSTLKRAKEIEADKPLMREVKAEAKREMKATQKVLGGGRGKK